MSHRWWTVRQPSACRSKGMEMRMPSKDSPRLGTFPARFVSHREQLLHAFRAPATGVLQNLQRLPELGQSRILADGSRLSTAPDPVEDARKVKQFAPAFKEIGV